MVEGMTVTTRTRTRHLLASGLSLVVGGGALVALAPPGAQATTGSVIYSCSAAGQTFDLPVVIDSNAPARIPAGDTVPTTLTAQTALPGSLAKLAKEGLAAESFTATIAAPVTVSGTQIPAEHTVTSTQLGDQSAPEGAAVPFQATGVAQLRSTTPGEVQILAGDFTASFNFKKADGTPTAIDPVQATCKAPNGKPPVIDTVGVVARSATQLTLSPARAAYGKKVTATAQVTTSGGAPDGDVAFVVGGVTTTAKVDKDGRAVLMLGQVAVGQRDVSATFTPKDATYYEGSSATPVGLTVTKAATRTRVTVTGKRTGKRTTATVKVAGVHGTVATGKVKVVLRKISAGGTKRKAGRLAKGSRGFNLGRLGRGKYKIVAKYVGDESHLRSRKVTRFRVR